jgi:hypothetical protein
MAPSERSDGFEVIENKTTSGGVESNIVVDEAQLSPTQEVAGGKLGDSPETVNVNGIFTHRLRMTSISQTASPSTAIHMPH